MATVSATLPRGAQQAQRGAPRRSALDWLRSNGLTWLGILLIAAYCLFPFYWMVVSSFQVEPWIFGNNFIPQHPTWANYSAVFGGRNHFGKALLNSVIVAGVSTVVALSVGMFASYALARLQFRFKALILGAILSIAMFPGIAMLIPLFQWVTDLGWIDTYQAMIIPDISFALPLTVWILTSFFAEMPWELEQAAKIDGATPGQAFRKVIVPLAAPGVFTTAILVFIFVWNEFLIAYTMTQTNAAQPVTVAITKFTGSSQFQQPFGTIMAAGVVVTIPLIIIVLIFQRRIVAGLTAGGVKG
jgi:multiple sugar transport system permease protein